MSQVPSPATVVLLLLIAACSRSPGGSGSTALEAATIKKRDPARVRVEPVVQREMLRILETTTRVESVHQVELMPRASGLVTQMMADEGDIVTSGQVLATLDARELVIAAADAEVALEEARAAGPRLEVATREAEARLATAKRSHEQAQRDYERNEAISKPGSDRPALLSPKDLDASRLLRDNALADAENAALALERARLDLANAKTGERRAELTLERARLNLSNASVTAPFDGILAARNIRAGDTVTMATSMFTLTDPQRLRAVFYRPQRELSLFLRGLESSDNALSGDARAVEHELFATAEALPGKRFRGALERIAPTIDPQSGNFRVTARLEGTPLSEFSASLLPGMLVRLEIVTERRANALVVPKRALRREGDVNMVFVVRDGRACRVPVKEGLTDDESLEVIPQAGATLQAGDQVVVVGNRDLEEGSEVTITTVGDALIEEPKPAAPEEGLPGAQKNPAKADPVVEEEKLPAPQRNPPKPAADEKAPPAEENAPVAGEEPPPAKPATEGGH